jgi:hypothetical protein
VAWSIPGAKGDKTRANIRFAVEGGNGGFTPARTLNEVKDAARFPVIEATPDGNFLIAWIDRRIDNPKPRQLYLMKIGAGGRVLTKNYPVGEGLCECCKARRRVRRRRQDGLHGRPAGGRQQNSQSRFTQIHRRRRDVWLPGAN